MTKLLLSAAMLAMLLPSAARAQIAAAPAGELVLVTGQAQASSRTTLELRALAKGDPVYAGDIVTTGPNTYANLKFTDGSFVLIRPKSRFEIEGYQAPPPAQAAAPAASGPAAAGAQADMAATQPLLDAQSQVPASDTGRAFFRLLKGGFRAVSGLIGRSDPAEYRVSSPVATIGIRGTDYLAVICDAACAIDPVVMASLIPGCDGTSGEREPGCDAPPERVVGGIIVGVITGRVVVVNLNGNEFEVRPGQYLLTLTDGTQILLGQMPDFLRVNPIPNPTELCES